MNLSLDGRHAFVGGASRGIGAVTAHSLAALGANVTLAARDEAALSETVAGLPARDGAEHRILPVDYADTQTLESAVREHAARHGPFSVLVHNSGGPPAGPAHTADPEAFLAAFRQHLVAGQVLVQALLPGMQSAGYGRIVNVISTSVKEPIQGLGVSNTIRAAVASWAKTLSRELAPLGITVNNVLPGYTRTERLGYIFEVRAQKTGRSVEDVEHDALAEVPAGRFAEPVEIANAIAFLASPAAAYVNGISLPVDGGRTRSL